MNRTLFIAGSLFAFAAVAAGAFGAHGLKEWFAAEPELQPIYQTAVHYQVFHALGMLIAALVTGEGARAARWAGTLFGAGILLFSGSLYALALGAPRIIGAITPFGGLAFLAGWLMLAAAGWKSSPH